MSDLRWLPGGSSYTDLVDSEGMVHGYVGPLSTGARGYVFEHSLGSQTTIRARITDHPTEEAARAHVEAEVARIYGGGDAA